MVEIIIPLGDPSHPILAEFEFQEDQTAEVKISG
jgi:hypothetical protein